jgi:Ankyrin repeats (many copies)
MPLLVSRRVKSQHEHGKGSRIPLSLQEVFIASNKGEADIVKPPLRNLAFKIFRTPFLVFKNKKSIPPNRQSSHPVIEITCTPIPDSDCSSVASLSRMPSKKKVPIPTFTPQKYLESLLRSRGYSSECYEVLASGYHNRPTQLQQACYGVYTVDVVRRNDDRTLATLFELGLHPNACNAYGESLVHLACRRGSFQALQVMIHNNCLVQVADDYGRTPLHDLCWATQPCYQSAAIVLEIDPRLLFMKDARGATPLSYARKEHWADWIRFLEAHKEEYWPKRYNDEAQRPPPLTQQSPNSTPIPDPKDPLSIRLATLVASGKISVEELEEIREDEKMGISYDDDSYSGSDSDISGNQEEYDVSLSTLCDGEEIDEIIETIKAMKASR